MITREEFSRLLVRHFFPVGSLSEQQIGELYRHYQLLELWNKKLNLTAIRKAEQAVVRHYCESLFLGTLLPADPVSVADIGSGGGFPGIPMAILRPDCRFALIESHQRKAAFLREAVRPYSHVRVLAERAEDLKTRFDWAVCRAVKWRRIAGAMCRLAKHLGFLTGEAEAVELMQIPEIEWHQPIRLPWGERRVVVIGSST